MTTREFINREFGVAGQSKSMSSVYKDERGNIYSYGRHYPLLFQVGELTFRNVVGYSNTTAKHINWTRDQGAIDVSLSGCGVYTWNNPGSNTVPYLLNSGADEATLLRAVFYDLEQELIDIEKRMLSKTRTNTKLYADLLRERIDCIDRIASVRPYVEAL